jgi:hypothetical protein
MSLSMIMLVLCTCYLLVLSSMKRENMRPLSFWAWLTLLDMMSSNYIHLPSNHMLSLFLMTK